MVGVEGRARSRLDLQMNAVAYVRVACMTSASVISAPPQPKDANCSSLSSYHHLHPLPHLPVHVSSASRIMSGSNLPSAMDVDEAAIDEGLYSRQL